jgi:hypothetical protein
MNVPEPTLENVEFLPPQSASADWDGITRSSPNFTHAFHLNGNAIGKATDSDSHPSVTTGGLKSIDEKVGRPVDHLGVAIEIRGGVDVTRNPDALNQTIEISFQRHFYLSDQVQGAEACRLLPLFEFEFPTQLPDEPSFSVPLRKLSGQEEQASDTMKRHVVGAWGTRGRKLESQSRKSFFNIVLHRFVSFVRRKPPL